MKNLVFSIAVFSIAALGACQQSGKHPEGQQPTTATPATEATLYACPMECEGDKTYDKAGKCPVCKMDLEAVTDAQQ
jgi:hypothetical protein